MQIKGVWGEVLSCLKVRIFFLSAALSHLQSTALALKFSCLRIFSPKKEVAVAFLTVLVLTGRHCQGNSMSGLHYRTLKMLVCIHNLQIHKGLFGIYIKCSTMRSKGWWIWDKSLHLIFLCSTQVFLCTPRNMFCQWATSLAQKFMSYYYKRSLNLCSMIAWCQHKQEVIKTW